MEPRLEDVGIPQVEGAPPSAGAPSPHLDGFKRFLKIETERLRIRHRFGLGGLEIAATRSDQADWILKRVCQVIAEDLGPSLRAELTQFAVVALGGYGRRELAPFSDIDVLFLHSGQTSDAVRTFVERVLMVLWDVGLTVGHSFRSVEECVAIAREDPQSRTALAEARLIVGNEARFAELRGELEAQVFGDSRVAESFVESMRLDVADRHLRFGRAVGVQEPNVKEGVGGLRDLHAVLWVGHALFGCRGLTHLHDAGRITDREYVTARKAYDAVLRLRHESHFTTGRRTDLLTLDLQVTLAENLGYKPRRALLASEILMREHYQRASELYRFCESFLLRAIGAMRRQGPETRVRRPRARLRGHFEAREGKLWPRAGVSHVEGNPQRLLEAFSLAQADELDLSEELRLAIRGSLRQVDRIFRGSRSASQAFLKVVRNRGRVAPALRQMHDTGFLGRFLPEFARVTFLVQHDFYHRYTVDEHTLRAVEALDEVVVSSESSLTRLQEVFGELKDAAPLYLGMLLHDIGKGQGGSHVPRGIPIAERVCRRLSLSAELTEQVLFLVEAHLEMSEISQRRDLSDEGLIESFAHRVGTFERLDMLLLLTYADHRGVGPGIWNEWKASLLWELYDRTRERLRGRAGIRPLGPGQAPARETAARALLFEFPASAVERHFALMPDKYLRATDAVQMALHFRLVQLLNEAPAADGPSASPALAAGTLASSAEPPAGDQPLVAAWQSHAARHHTELTVATHDRPGLFAMLAGTLTAHGINILSVDLYTRDDGVVLDVFKLSEVGGPRPVRPRRWSEVERDLKGAVQGLYAVGEAVTRWREKVARGTRRKGLRAKAPLIHFDSLAADASTVVEVRAEDQPGLAYTIAQTLADLGLDITFAKIATAKTQALDVFYVADAEGRKLSPAETPKIEKALLAALGARSMSESMKEAG